jgi:hypothetical protein
LNFHWAALVDFVTLPHYTLPRLRTAGSEVCQ